MALIENPSAQCTGMGCKKVYQQRDGWELILEHLMV